MTLFRAILLFVALILMNGCEAIWSFSALTKLPQGEKTEIKIAAVNHPLVFNRENSFGLEAEMLEQFASESGYKIIWHFVPSVRQAIEDVKSGKADLASGRINLNTAYDTNLLMSPSYEESPLQLICPRERHSSENQYSFFERLLKDQENSMPTQIKKIAVNAFDFKGNVASRVRSAYPDKQIMTVELRQGKDLLKMMSKNRDHCALLEKNEARYFLRFYPSLQIIREFGPPVSLGFLISPERRDLQRMMMSWFQTTSRTLQIAKIRDRNYGHLESLNDMDQLRYFKNIQNHLGELNSLFKKSAQEFHLPWQLIAAVAYQESHWNNEAVSFTGVRGIMMLTEETAVHVGIDDRTNLEQSIWGGAKYLKMLMDIQPKFLSMRDKIILTLITYNVGPAHLLDAQRLAIRMGRNPYSWKDLKDMLPLLSQPEYYETLEYGQARGDEPVDFTNRVMGFYELLSTKI